MKLEFNFNQSGVIPYRKTDNEIEVLLITSMKKKKWIVPKGFIEFNLSGFESAKKEAFEEAGVLGTNETMELGSYNVKKDIGLTHVKIYSMEVIEEVEDYPEKKGRKRKWYPLKEAAAVVSIPELSEMILALKEKLKAA
ncbi:MAG: NUDIX hydrolase [Ignavibacteriaceae bacterium]